MDNCELLKNYIIDIFSILFCHPNKDEPEHIDPDLLTKLINLYKYYDYDEDGWPDFTDKEYAKSVINDVRKNFGYSEIII